MAFKKNSRVKYFPERILKRISESEHYPLTIISGTMGYGKTTLARHYCKMNNLTAIWITIISSSLKVLWEQFCDGVREYHIDIADTLIFPSDDMKLAGCIRQLQHVAAQFTIVLDNFHVVKCDNLVRFIISVINAIPAIRIILISREKILGLKHELNLDGKVNYIYTDDLMFTISEIRSYFKACGVMLKIEDA